MNECYVVESW